MTQKLSISRRELVGGALGAGLAASAGGLLLWKGDGHSAKRGLITPGAGRPRYGGRIRVSSIASSTADTLDPAKGGLSTDYARHNMFYNGLTRYDGFLNAQLELAEVLESSDRQLWRVKLRKDVAFHDGKPLTSADVVYSLLRHKLPATASKMKSIADQFAEVRADGSHEVLIRLTGPNADLPAILAQTHFLIIRDGTKNFHTANGTGPYRCADFQPGVRTVGVRNPHYWKHGRPFLDEIELIAIPDEVSRVNALLSGDVHMVNSVDPRSTKRINESGTHAVIETQSGLYTDFIMQQNMLPTSNPHFVLAMKYLLDRELIRRALFRNYAVIANDHPIPPNHRYFNSEIPQRQYDLDRAKYHIRQAGLSGARLPMFASPAAEASVDMASVLQEYGSRIGVNFAVNRVPSDGYWSTHWMKHPLTFGNTNPRPTADLLFSLFFKSDADWNEAHWRNPQFDQLLVEARGDADEARRKQLYGEMQQMVHDQGGVAIPVFISLIDGHDLRLKGLHPIPIGGLMGYMFADQVWWDG